MEKFYGVKQASYTIYLVSLYGHVGYGPILETKAGTKHICAVIGTWKVKNDLPVFEDREYLTDMQRHEFSHPFVNPLTTRFSSEVKKSSFLFEKRMGTAVEKGICGDWDDRVNESVVRAVVIHLIGLADGDTGFKEQYKYELSQGAVLTPDILAAIDDYLAKRQLYPTFADYYPVLLAKLAQLK